MKIYTRTGGKGKTSLFQGGRVDKFDTRVETCGTLDELNSWLGFARAFSHDHAVIERLTDLQRRIHLLCSDIASADENGPENADSPRIPENWIAYLESGIGRMDEDLPQLKNFILPGGSQSGASLHLARTVCRRAERSMHRLVSENGYVSPPALKFVNRLSDYLFTLARWANMRDKKEEIKWENVGHSEISGQSAQLKP